MAIRSTEPGIMLDSIQPQPRVDKSIQPKLELLAVLNRSIALTYQGGAYSGYRAVLEALIDFYGSATYARQRLHRINNIRITKEVMVRMSQLEQRISEIEDVVYRHLLYDTTPDSVILTLLENGVNTVRQLAVLNNHPDGTQEL